MGHKLSILPRQFDKTGWHVSKQFDTPSVQQIKVDGSGKGRSLNAIPSPFARMHLFETAFEMVYQDLINNTQLAGEAYNRIVSDCLDVFELIYNWESHVSEGINLEIVSWRKENELHDLINSSNLRHKLLGQTLTAFFDGEKAFQNFSDCLIVKYNGKVIAGTSPFTGFITTPDEIGSLGLLKPLSQVTYFSRITKFQDRSSELKKYIYDFFESNEKLRLSENCAAIRSFLEWHSTQGNIPLTAIVELHPISIKGIQYSFYEKQLNTSTSVGTQFFEKHIVRFNYRFNSEYFILPRWTNNDRDYDYTIPLTISFFEQYDYNKLQELVEIQETDLSTVEVRLKIGNKVVTKKYQQKPLFPTDGKIIDLYEDHRINFNLGIFPFLKITNQPEGLDYNDFYRVMLTFEDVDGCYNNKEINVKFGKNKRFIEGGSILKINRNDRTIFEKDKSPVGSTYFGLNTCFDFLQIEFPFEIEGSKCRGIIIPKWKEKNIGPVQLDFAIDMGTTSTFLAYTDDINHQSVPRPFEFTEKELPVILLNRPKEKRQEFSWNDCYETVSSNLLLSIEIQKQEFIPSIIKKNEKYEFPIRTALYQQKAIDANQKRTLQNANIAFAYQKKDVANLALINQEFKTNLKWNIKTSTDFESAIQVFIEELFILIRTKILLNNGDPRKTKICWFSPLSFTSASKRAYTDLWNKYSKDILKYTTDNIYNTAESEAPAYYFFKNAEINNSNSVLTLDIGGGSTDIMLFNETKPVMGTSVHFGANVLWGNGFSNFLTEKTNGIYNSLKNQISENLRQTELKAANEEYCSADNNFAGSDEIINFWIANKELTKVLDLLKKNDYKLSYLIHLSALIFHSLKLLKVKGKLPPTCIIFSGNGSKYIDLIHDSKCIEKIWGYFGRKIFNPDYSNPQVILPQSNRKEATCFGGLFAQQTSSKYEVENYLGFEEPGEKFEKYRDVELNKELVFKNTLIVFNEFIDMFFAMNDVRELNFREEFGIELKLNSFKKYLKEKARENLIFGFEKRLEQVDKDDFISDSIFYYPLVGLIYKLNNLTQNDIENLVERTIWFSSGPDGESEFLVSKCVNQIRNDTIYTITIENDHPDFAIIDINNDLSAQKRALAAFQGFIDPVCVYTEFPQPGKHIKVLTKGTAKKIGDKWIIQDKLKIEFV